MSDEQTERVAKSMHAAMLRSPAFAGKIENSGWDHLRGWEQSEYRAVAHSALVAAMYLKVWTAIAHEDCDDYGPWVVSVATSREAALDQLAEHYDGIKDCAWDDSEYPGQVYKARLGTIHFTIEYHPVDGARR